MVTPMSSSSSYNRSVLVNMYTRSALGYISTTVYYVGDNVIDQLICQCRNNWRGCGSVRGPRSLAIHQSAL